MASLLMTVRVVTAVMPEIVKILLPAVGVGGSAEVWARTRTVAEAPTTVSAHQDGRLVAAACIDVEGSQGRLTAISVSPDRRPRGCGRSLVAALPSLLGLGVLTAETDSAAVGCYRALGFSATSLGERYPGVERFHCRLEPVVGASPGTGLVAPTAPQQWSTGEQGP